MMSAPTVVCKVSAAPNRRAARRGSPAFALCRANARSKIELSDSMISLLRYAEGFGEASAGPVEVPCHQGHRPQIAKHGLQQEEVTGLSAETLALDGGGYGGVQVALEEGMNGPGLDQFDRRRGVIQPCRCQSNLIKVTTCACLVF